MRSRPDVRRERRRRLLASVAVKCVQVPTLGCGCSCSVSLLGQRSPQLLAPSETSAGHQPATGVATRMAIANAEVVDRLSYRADRCAIIACARVRRRIGEKRLACWASRDAAGLLTAGRGFGTGSVVWAAVAWPYCAYYLLYYLIALYSPSDTRPFLDVRCVTTSHDVAWPASAIPAAPIHMRTAWHPRPRPRSSHRPSNTTTTALSRRRLPPRMMP